MKPAATSAGGPIPACGGIHGSTAADCRSFMGLSRCGITCTAGRWRIWELRGEDLGEGACGERAGSAAPAGAVIFLCYTGG